MSWPVGYGVSGVKYSATRDGTIFADGVAVTDANGWVDLPATVALRNAGAPESYSLRVRLSVDAHGKPFFYAEEAEVAGVRYGGLYALARARGGDWLSAPILAVRERIEQRRRAGREGAVVARVDPRGETQAVRAGSHARLRAETPLRANREDTWSGLERVRTG